MSILDEDKSNFADSGGRFLYYSKMIKEYLQDAVILMPRCYRVSCNVCIGRKYEITNGCPVCGVKLADRIDEFLYRCKECESIIASCGDDDVSAVGISKIWLELRAKEDTI